MLMFLLENNSMFLVLGNFSNTMHISACRHRSLPVLPWGTSFKHRLSSWKYLIRQTRLSNNLQGGCSE